MLGWRKTVDLVGLGGVTEVPAAKSARADTGPYRLLFQYLRDRYADRVVLTFNEIEDLIGFLLPEAARADETWWNDAVGSARRSPQADAWRCAGRIAAVNMSAQRVLFEKPPTG